ncbi:hypothetical protein [Saccharopolyspora hattusasensis]|uniref:hypothetical protein n=1 Tax=Saccharopolyspora hattusasensis TaxID=1128679 RepID=UPI003D96A557
MAEPNASVVGVAEDAARSVLEAHGFTPEAGESPVTALGWALGEGTAREATLRKFAQALIDTVNVRDLVEAQIELFVEYKLDSPQDCPNEDRDRSPGVTVRGVRRAEGLSASAGHSKAPMTLRHQRHRGLAHHPRDSRLMGHPTGGISSDAPA